MAIKIQMNKSTNNLNKLRIYLRAISKFGKTSLFRNMILEEYNGDASKGLLVGINNEIGYTLLDNLQTTHCNTWKDLKELSQFLIKGKGTEHNIEMVCFDVVDEIIPIAEKEICRQSQIQTGKPCDSINKAFSGYGMGQAKLKELVKEYFTNIYKAGFGIMCISHTKLKTIVEKGKTEDEGYMVLTSNLPNTYESIFADIFDLVLTGVIDKEVKDGKIESTERRLYFRGTTTVEAGTRFANDTVPEYLVVDSDQRQFAKDFLKTIKDGMRNSASNPLTEKEVEESIKEEKKQTEIELQKVQQEVEEEQKEDEKVSKKELMAQIKDKAQTKEQRTALLEYVQNECSKTKVRELTIEELEKALKLI